MDIVIRKTGSTFWPGGSYLIRSGDRFISELTFDEMLGFVAAWGLQSRELFWGMRTYEEQVSEWPSRFHYFESIAGLLSYDSTVVNPTGSVVGNFLFSPFA